MKSPPRSRTKLPRRRITLALHFWTLVTYHTDGAASIGRTQPIDFPACLWQPPTARVVSVDISPTVGVNGTCPAVDPRRAFAWTERAGSGSLETLVDSSALALPRPIARPLS